MVRESYELMGYPDILGRLAVKPPGPKANSARTLAEYLPKQRQTLLELFRHSLVAAQGLLECYRVQVKMQRNPGEAEGLLRSQLAE